jgi:hypothetical protein
MRKKLQSGGGSERGEKKERKENKNAGKDCAPRQPKQKKKVPL